MVLPFTIALKFKRVPKFELWHVCRHFAKLFVIGRHIHKFRNMKALKVSYSRLISKGNYENAKIEIELEVEEGEKASDVFEAAKAFVENRIGIEKVSQFMLERAKKVMDDKRNHTLAQIEEAEEILAKAKVDDELPF